MKVLISSVGRRNYIVEYFREFLKDPQSVIAVNSIEDASGILAAEQYIIAPPIESSNYIQFLLSACVENNVNLLVSLFDQDLMKISENKDLFERIGVKVAVSGKNVIETTFDKYLFSGFLSRNNLLTPATYQSSEAIINQELTHKLKFPLMLKPRWGTGSIATEKVNDETELFFFVKYLRNKVDNTYLKNTYTNQAQNEILIQEYITGDEYHLDVINDLSGNYVTAFPKKKLAMRSGETDSAITIENEDLMIIAEKIGSALKHIGPLDVDLIRNDKGEYFIIDANPRFGGGYPFAHAAGANIPACLVSWTRNETPDSSWLKAKPGVLGVKGIKLFRKEL